MKKFHFAHFLLQILTVAAGVAQHTKIPWADEQLYRFDKIETDGRPEIMKAFRWSPIAVFENEIHALYGSENGIFYNHSTDNGETWQPETLIHSEKNSHGGYICYAPFTACVETDCQGAVHLFLIESYFYEEVGKPSRVLHYSRKRNETNWNKETVDSSSGIPMLGFDIDCFIGKDNAIHLAYCVGEKYTRYAVNRGAGWKYSDIQCGVRPYGSSVAADSKGNVFVAIGVFQDGVYLAESPQGQAPWKIEKVDKTDNWPTDIAIGKDNSVHIVYIPSEITHHNSMGYARRIKGRMEVKIFDSNKDHDPNLQGYNGNNMIPRIKADPEGNLHIVSYGHWPYPGTQKELIYLRSRDNGKTWQQQWLAEDVCSYIESGFPDVDWNRDFLFISYKTNQEKPAILRTPYIWSMEFPSTPCKEPKPRANTMSDILSAGDPPGFSQRLTELSGEFKSKDSVITVEVWDGWKPDNDTISLKYGDKWILKKHPLTKEKIILTLKVKPGGSDRFLIYADSEGDLPPCTVHLLVRDSEQEVKFVVSPGLSENRYLVVGGDK